MDILMYKTKMSRAVAKKKDMGLKVASILLEYTELTAFPESGTASYHLHKSETRCQQHRWQREPCA